MRELKLNAFLFKKPKMYITKPKSMCSLFKASTSQTYQWKKSKKQFSCRPISGSGVCGCNNFALVLIFFSYMKQLGRICLDFVQKFTYFILEQNRALLVLFRIAFQTLAQFLKALLLYLVYCYSNLDCADSKFAPKSKLDKICI